MDFISLKIWNGLFPFARRNWITPHFTAGGVWNTETHFNVALQQRFTGGWDKRAWFLLSTLCHRTQSFQLCQKILLSVRGSVILLSVHAPYYLMKNSTNSIAVHSCKFSIFPFLINLYNKHVFKKTEFPPRWLTIFCTLLELRKP